MGVHCRRWAAAAASLAAVLCALAWCSSGPLAGEHAAGGRPARTRGRSLAVAAARGPASAGRSWRRIGPGLPIPGQGSGDCTGCRVPIQSPESRNLTLRDCQEWLEAGCPNVPNLPQGCPHANALGYKLGAQPEEQHLCRAWACDDAPGWTGDVSWNCFSWAESPAPEDNTTEGSTTPTTTLPATSRPGRPGGGNVSTTTRDASPAPAPIFPHCYEHPDKTYKLDWRAMGHGFFDDWAFHLEDYNNGAAEYLNREEAVRNKVVEAFGTHAIVRTGPRGAGLKRQSVKIASRRTWKYGLMGMRFSHVPWGCGLWPAFWTHAPGYRWPEGGEFDIFEYVNDVPSQTSFHTGARNRCQLAGSMINQPFCPVMPDMNGMNYDCTTKYPAQLGCAVNKLPLLSPYEWAQFPSAIMVEWTERFVKVFVIPEREIPQDLREDEPKPDTWDRWLVSYYPFALSNERWNGTCPNPGEVMQPQQLVLQINFCGDWAGKIWPLSSSCVNRVGPKFPYQCRAVDPLLDRRPGSLQEDCCTQFIVDANGTYGTDAYLAERAYFNISWVKVWSSAS